ncbi:MAG: TlyA family RNA methyltransferase, partial [Pseudomonadota bacterium]
MSRRLDQHLADSGLTPSRARARDLIRRGLVHVDGSVETRPARMVADQHKVSVAGGADDVSRGAEKLRAGLQAFGINPAGQSVLDIGASTGGFTQTLLAQAAARVIAVDVGRGQLHASLRSDTRVLSLEGRDARTLGAADTGGPVDGLVADLSFVSLQKVLPAPLGLVRGGGWLIALIKPQFEVGRAHIGKGGIVTNPKATAQAETTFMD